MTNLISFISQFAPVLGTALGGPSGAIVGGLISSILGVDMSKPDDVINHINNNPECIDKLKALEDQLTDIQDARAKASSETGYIRLVRPFLAVLGMLTIFGDIFLIDYVKSEIVKQILIVMLVFLVWDIRQIYKFYFGSSDDLPNVFEFFKKK